MTTLLLSQCHLSLIKWRWEKKDTAFRSQLHTIKRAIKQKGKAPLHYLATNVSDYMLTLVAPAPFLPVCSDVRGAVPTAATSLPDFSHQRGLTDEHEICQKWDCHAQISNYNVTLASQQVSYRVIITLVVIESCEKKGT